MDPRIPGILYVITCNNTEPSIEPLCVFGFRAGLRASDALHWQAAFGISVRVRAAALLGCVELTGSSQHE